MQTTDPWLPAPSPPSGDPDRAEAAAVGWSYAEATSPEPAPPPRRSWFKRRLGPVLAALVALVSKLKTLLLLLPKVKLLASAATMAISLAAYSFVFGWQFAAGFVALLFIHEMGHVIALRREGIKASTPMFVPFLGAVISARSLGDNALAEARVGLAGPILGSVGAAASVVLWQLTGNDLWRALAFTGFFLNLFNLLPVVPLDGGRAMAAMAPWMWFLGFAAMIALVFEFPNPLILVVVLFAALETSRRWKQRRAGGREQQAYYSVKPVDRLLVAAVYLSLVACLVIGMHATTVTATFA